MHTLGKLLLAVVAEMSLLLVADISVLLVETSQHETELHSTRRVSVGVGETREIVHTKLQCSTDRLKETQETAQETLQGREVDHK